MFTFAFNKLHLISYSDYYYFAYFANIIYFQQMYTHSKHTNVHMSFLSEYVSHSLTFLAPEDNVADTVSILLKIQIIWFLFSNKIPVSYG